MIPKKYLKKAGYIGLPVIVVAGAVIYAVAQTGKPVIPADFTAARQNASQVSQDIVSLTATVNQRISDANAAESRGDTTAVMVAINDARTANASAYEKAFTLSQSLQQMTESMTTIDSSQSQKLAYDAVAVELSLVSEFISYTGSLNDFLNSLARSIATNNAANRAAVAADLKVVNDKAATIDQLNQEFGQKMASFDASVK